jgi:hypothetical protein
MREKKPRCEDRLQITDEFSIPCALPAGHKGWHQDSDRLFPTQWEPTPPESQVPLMEKPSP